MQQPWLIQRGEFNNTQDNEINGLDSLVRFDYMGSSEFEFGALPQSYKHILKNHQTYKFKKIKLKTKDETPKYIFIFADKNDLEDVSMWIKIFSKKPYHNTKEVVGIYEAINGLKKSYTKCNFWWDIENHWFAFINTENQERINIAIQKNIERNVPDLTK